MSQSRRRSARPQILVVAVAMAGCSSQSPDSAPPLASALQSGRVVRIVSVATGGALDVEGASTQDGARVQEWTYAAGENQQWELRADADASGRYAIVNKRSGACLDVSGWSTEDGTTLQQWTCSGQANQRWALARQTDGSFALLSASSGKCVDLAGASANDGTAIQEWSCAAQANQRWWIEDVSMIGVRLNDAVVGASVSIASVASGKVLDVAGASTSNGALVQQWDDARQGNQRWRLTPTTSGGYTIENSLSGKCLEVLGAADADGARVDQWDCWGGANQQWIATPAAGGYALVSLASGKCLDVSGASAQNGALLQQWSCSGAANQAFVFGVDGAPSPAPSSLRAAGDAAGKWIGTALSTAHLSDPRYAASVASEFNYVTPENEMKWDATEPAPGHFDYSGGDAIVAFAKANGMRVKGHTLAWHNQLPGWMRATTDAGAVRAAVDSHLTALVTHYKRQLAAWDVVNEAIDDNPPYALRSDAFDAALGYDGIAQAFRAAHAIDPGALLFYNDYGIEGLGGKADGMYALVKRLVADGVPISGVGLQTHLGVTSGASAAEIAANMHRIAALGLLVNVSEMDINVCEQPGSEADKLVAQSRRMHDIVGACMSEGRCVSLTFWGVADPFSWLNTFAPCAGGQAGQPWPLVLDESFARKPSWQGVVDALLGK